jgi:hypothetical protein
MKNVTSFYKILLQMRASKCKIRVFLNYTQARKEVSFTVGKKSARIFTLSAYWSPSCFCKQARIACR